MSAIKREIVAAVMQLLDEKGESFVQTHDIDVVVCAMIDWLQGTRRGLEFMSFCMELDSIRGDNSKKYSLREGHTRLTTDIKPENIIFLRGCIIGGDPVPVSLVEITEREEISCECCGAIVICAVAVGGKLEKLCTKCIKGSEEYAMSCTPEVDCDECSYERCEWHPSNTRTLLDYHG